MFSLSWQLEDVNYYASVSDEMAEWISKAEPVQFETFLQRLQKLCEVIK